MVVTQTGRIGDLNVGYRKRARPDHKRCYRDSKEDEGARRSEISELKWSEIDFEQGFLWPGDTKTGMSIRPISKLALDLLDLQPREHPKWIEVWVEASAGQNW